MAGATGLVGGHVLAQLLAGARVTYHRPCNPIHDPATLPTDAEWWAVDGAICAIGRTRSKAGSAAVFRAIDHDYALTIATRIRSNGATRFALTAAMGANARSRLLYSRTKGELEAAVTRLGFASLTIVRTGVPGGHRAEQRPIERMMEQVSGIAAPILPMIARISPASGVAALLVNAAIDGDGSGPSGDCGQEGGLAPRPQMLSPVFL